MKRTYRCVGCGALNRVPVDTDKTPICGRCKERLDTSGAPQEVTAEELERVVKQAPVPVLVDFWAEWCPPCRMAGPILDDLARKLGGSAIVLKVNSDEQPQAAGRHAVQSLPTFVLFKGGHEASRQVGLPPRAAFQQWVERETRA
jgi:thioredoxin 2